MLKNFVKLFRSSPAETEAISTPGQIDFADQLAQTASSVLSIQELTSGIATRILEDSVEANETYATSNVYGSRRGEPTFVRATKLEKQGDLKQASMSDMETIASRLYKPEIEELSKRILAHFQTDTTYNRRDTEPVIFSVHTADVLIGQAVITLSVNAAIHTIIETASKPTINAHDLNGGNALVVQIDARMSGEADNSQTAAHIIAQQDDKEAIHGTQTATGLLIIAGPNEARRASHYAKANLETFRARTRESQVSMGSPPLILVATDSKFEMQEGQVLLPAITEAQWEQTYIPKWLKQLGILKSLREIAGPTLSRVDTMLAVATLEKARSSWDASKESFEKHFSKGTIPPAILRDIAVNMIRFGTRFSYEHLNNPSNLARSLQLMLGITGFIDETGKIPPEKRDACLSILKADQDDAKIIMADVAQELFPMAGMQGFPPSFEFKSFGLFAVLRQLNQQEVMLNIKSLVFKFPPETRLCCGHCLRGVQMADAACDGCGAPGGSFVFQIIPVKK